MSGSASPSAALPVVPISALFYSDEGPHILSTAEAGEEPGVEERVVPVESLLLRGDAALREALALRPAVERLLADSRLADAELGRVMDELFELVRLGLPPEAGRG